MNYGNTLTVLLKHRGPENDKLCAGGAGCQGLPGTYTKGTLIRHLNSVKDAKVCCLPLSEPPAP